MTPAENKALRESMGLTLKWLAERWGVTVQSVKRGKKTEAARKNRKKFY